MFGSARDDWETPKELFEEWNKEFGFTVDVCASEVNCKIKNYYSKEQNGLEQEWKGIAWCNPPYGRKVGKWVKKRAKVNVRPLCYCRQEPTLSGFMSTYTEKQKYDF